ncbi:DUF2970 domain-containing protein [Herbaspirillum rhizosphaerae]|uniref:DUF2970 domain-containing protein n=1 Tax=Herbaspirillum rhizosphaerae TaxID=346179 RepID=UPI00067E3038|nr:DUF2970 domain-containing protein [Herbaspirillum rhizosphaerae]
MKPLPSLATQKRSFLSTLAAVFWSFAGLRRRADYEKDATSLNPFYVIAAGLIAVGIFIAVLLVAVRMAVSG